jgi:hypothetical protein
VNAGQLVDYIRTLTGQALQAVATGHILDLINTAQEEISRETKLPRKVIQYDNLTASNQLVLPLDARKESLIAVYHITKDDNQVVTGSRSMPIYDFIAASRLHPSWTTWDPSGQPTFIMYDPAFDPDCPRPAPGPSVTEPQSFRLIYVMKPDRVTGLDSPVLDGKFTGLTTVLAYRVAYLITRDAVMLREYERSMNALAGQSRPATVVAQNPLYKFNAPEGARG